jgi:hypothetical protein
LVKLAKIAIVPDPTGSSLNLSWVFIAAAESNNLWVCQRLSSLAARSFDAISEHRLLFTPAMKPDWEVQLAANPCK